MSHVTAAGRKSWCSARWGGDGAGAARACKLCASKGGTRPRKTRSPNVIVIIIVMMMMIIIIIVIMTRCNTSLLLLLLLLLL